MQLNMIRVEMLVIIKLQLQTEGQADRQIIYPALLLIYATFTHVSTLYSTSTFPFTPSMHLGCFFVVFDKHNSCACPHLTCCLFQHVSHVWMGPLRGSINSAAMSLRAVLLCGQNSGLTLVLPSKILQPQHSTVHRAHWLKRHSSLVLSPGEQNHPQNQDNYFYLWYLHLMWSFCSYHGNQATSASW